ncbi:unnamed protein product [Oikopleura dioica]|uniref:Phospholipase A2 domain-containing protein n=1 Tax=Oikopleura dioica TaxID=34765 RepID=E4Y944_OIKDI|nr:unnamed protein product [Oikopleura dioica]
MEEWQTNLQNAFRAGASRGDLGKLLLAGRRLRLDLMIDYETDSKFALEDLEDTGCYGNPLQKGEESYPGKGTPVDLIDELSKSLLFCYKCAAKDHGAECKGRGNYNSSFNKRAGAKCLDRKDTCEYTICQCDLQFAKVFGKMSISFDESYSVKNGFKREERCVAKAPKEAGIDSRLKNSGNKAQKSAAAETECCGFGLGRTIFKVDKQVCCDGDTVKPIGSC